MYDIIIIGGGPAGMTAAIYARRNGKSVMLLEKEGYGGQLAAAPRIENYPGVPAVEGAVLAERITQQMMELDTDTDIGTVCEIRRADGIFTVSTEEGDSYEARAVIVAAGARHRHLGLPGEEELLGSGVSYCAVCDGSFYAGRDVAVAGGGDSALQEALLLSEICRKVYIIHRRDTFRGDAEKQRRLFARPNVEKVTDTVVSALQQQNGELTGLTLTDNVTGKESFLPVEALFVSIGSEPVLESFRDLLTLDRKGYAVAGEDGRTAVEGLFAAGDCRAKSVRQLATAVGDGANAALEACKYLEA